MLQVKKSVLLASCCLASAISAALVVLVSRLGAPLPTAQAASAPAEPERGEEQASGVDSLPALQPILRNLVTPSGYTNRKAVRALAALGPSAVRQLLPQFTGDDTPFQRALLRVFSLALDQEVAAKLLAVLKDAPPFPMARAIGELVGRAPSEDRCDALIELASDPAETCRAGAAWGLRKCASTKAALALLTMVKRDRSAQVRLSALQALREAPEEVLKKAVFVALNDPQPQVRAEAAKLAGERGLTDQREAIQLLLREDPEPEVRRACRRALSLLALAERRKAVLGYDEDQ